jgi:hypothetical protein
MNVGGAFACAKNCYFWLCRNIENREKTARFLQKSCNFRSKQVDFHRSQLSVVVVPRAAGGAAQAAKQVRRFTFRLRPVAIFIIYINKLKDLPRVVAVAVMHPGRFT